MQTTKFQLRLSDDLHAQLAAAADENHRSLNAEITARLESTFGAAGIEDRIAALERAVFKPKRPPVRKRAA